MHRRTENLAVLSLSVFLGGCSTFFHPGQHPSVAYDQGKQHTNETIRDQVQMVRIDVSTSKPTLRISGDYGSAKPSVGRSAGDGAIEGAKVGAQVAMEIAGQDPRGLILLPLLVPITTITGTIVGATSAKIQKELMELRESITNDMAGAGNRPSPNEKIAEEITEHLRQTDEIEIVSAGADTVLRVAVTSIVIETDNKDATISATASASLHRAHGGRKLDSLSITYHDRDSLRDWAANDMELWFAFGDQARRYIASEIVAHFFERIEVRHVLRPTKTASTSGTWSESTRSSTPTLGWELILLGGDSYVSKIDSDNIKFDLRIFDNSGLIYESRNIEGTTHKVGQKLRDCSRLSWTVRPVYRIGNKTRTGAWMREQAGEGEFWQDFATIRTRCSS
jgi:hypothetical protein